MSKEFDFGLIGMTPPAGSNTNKKTDTVTTMIKIDDLDIITKQPFRPYSDEELQELQKSIKENGLLAPLVVNKDNGRYKILSGRNRYTACLALEYKEIPCIVLEVDKAKAELILVDSNLQQRQELLTSEKAQAYKIKIASLSAIKNQSLTQSIADLSQSENTTERTIYRYLQLSELPLEMLNLIDAEQITITAALLLKDFKSYTSLCDALTTSHKKINDKKAEALIRLEVDNNGYLSPEMIIEFLNYKNEPARKSFKLDGARLEEVMTNYKDMPDDELEDYIINAIDFYQQNH